MPAIAHAPDRDTATGIYLKGLRTISLVATPLVIGCCLKAKGLVLLVLGPAWLPAAPLVAVLTPLGLLHAYFQLNTAALIGLGEVGVQLKLSVLTSVLGLIGIVAGMPWGSQGVAIGYAIGTVAAAAPYFRAVLTVLGAPWRSLVSGLGRASFAGAVMICALLLRAHLAPVRPAFWDLPESGLLGLGAYAVALLFLEVVRPAYLAPRARGLSVAQAQT
jgi:PST family polysaccharide transporter